MCCYINYNTDQGCEFCMQMCIESLQMCTKEKLLKRLEHIALVPGVFITGWLLRMLMDFFHDVGSVKYIMRAIQMS